MKRDKLGVIALIIIILALGVGAIIIGNQLMQTEDTTPDDTSAASPQVTNADRLKTQGERDGFNMMWQTFADDPSNGIDEYIEYALGDGARYECNTPIADQVGTETLYGCDLNVAFVIHDFPKYISTEQIGPTDANLNAVMDELITQSGMLQIAAERGTIELDNTFFNSPTKNHTKRLDILSQIRPDLENEFVKKMDFEMVVMYFHNQYPPEGITLEEARAAAETKINLVYDQLVGGTITMQEAGDQIINNTIPGDRTGITSQQLDPLVETNAYSNILQHHFENRAFIDETFEEEIRSLGEGQMSAVRTFKDFDFASLPEGGYYFDGEESLPMIESGFVIFKLNNIDFGYSSEIETLNVDDVEDAITNEYKENANIQL